MKNISFLLPVVYLILSSCQSVDLVRDSRVDFYGFDFREYAENGFLFTPEKPLSDGYKSLGLLEIQSRPEIVELKQAYYEQYKQTGFLMIGGKSYRVIRILNPSKQYFGIEIIDADNVIKDLYSKAMEWGANAIVNFKVATIYENVGGGVIEVPVVTISGLAIRKD